MNCYKTSLNFCTYVIFMLNYVISLEHSTAFCLLLMRHIFKEPIDERYPGFIEACFGNRRRLTVARLCLHSPDNGPVFGTGAPSLSASPRSLGRSLTKSRLFPPSLYSPSSLPPARLDMPAILTGRSHDISAAAAADCAGREG